jgi:hypothetical protein
MFGTSKRKGNIKMLVTINERNGHKTRFKNYRRLYYHICSRQRAKRFGKSLQNLNEWVFMHHSYRRILALYEFVKSRLQANDSGKKGESFDVLEMAYDKSMKPIIIPITPDLDIEPHLEEWCRRYCQSHRLKLIEIEEQDGILRVKEVEHPCSDEERKFYNEALLWTIG